MAFEKILGTSLSNFTRNLFKEISDDEIFNGAAALSFYWLLALFPAMIFLLSVIPYLPIDNLHQAIMQFIGEMLPAQAASLFSGVVTEVVSQQNTGLLSFGIIATIWASSTGLYAIMQQLNKTYDVKEARPFWKARGIAVLMTFVFGLIIIGAFALIVFGGVLQEFMIGQFGHESMLLPAFRVFRWVVITALLLFGFALIYYYGPNVEQDFKFITVGSVIAVVLLILAALGFQYYVNNFANYAKTYGSLGAVIILMMFLYISGVVILLGSEINATLEHFHPAGKEKGEHYKGEKQDSQGAGRQPLPV